MITIVEGNILNATENIICHQVNCMGTMGSGLAKQIRNSYPKVYAEYVKLLNWAKEEYKRGYSVKKYPLGSVQFVEVSDKKVIANIFGQLKYGTDKRYTDYDALKKGLSGVLETVTWDHMNYKGYSVAIPYGIGCGLAGGDWEVVYKIIEEVFKDYNVTIYKLKE